MIKRKYSQKHEEQIVSEIERWLPAFRSFAAGLCGNQFVADDLVQSACERALGRLDQVKDVTGVKSWVYRIIYTQWQDLLRKRKSRKAKFLSFGQYRFTDQQTTDIRGERRKIARMDIERGLDRLSGDHRAALALVALAGYNYQEASEVLDIPVGTVASRVARAKALLAEYMRPQKDGINTKLKYRRLCDESNG